MVIRGVTPYYIIVLERKEEDWRGRKRTSEDEKG